MSEQQEPQVASASDQSKPPWQGPIIDKSPPRPAPTEEYSWATYHPSAKVIYIRDHERADLALAELDPKTDILGFDLEWRPTYVKGRPENPVALVQLANDDNILLIQLTAMKKFPPKLAELLANPEIVKAGVGVQSDAKKLFNDYHVPIRNCVDLTLLAKTVDNARWSGKYNMPLGLARLIESYEYKLLSKGKITRSNWEARLTQQQQDYASNDAHAGYVLYRRLRSMLSSMESTPEPSWYTCNILSGFLCTPAGLPWTPENPDYDPGPQPPPKELTEEQKERIERRKQQKLERSLNAVASSSTNQPHGSEYSPPAVSPDIVLPPGQSSIGQIVATSMAFPQGSLEPLRNSHPRSRPPFNTGRRGGQGGYHNPPNHRRPRYDERHQNQQPRPNNNIATSSVGNPPLPYSLREPSGLDNHARMSNPTPHAQPRHFHSNETSNLHSFENRSQASSQTNTQSGRSHRPYRHIYHSREASAPVTRQSQGSSRQVSSNSAGPPPAASGSAS